jgi:hypothetical protein
MRKLAALLTLSVSALLGSMNFAPSRAQALYSSDLAFHFHCDGRSRAEIEQLVSTFLKGSGFGVLNLGRIQREHNYYELDLNALGLDDGRRIVRVSSEPLNSGWYNLSLRSPPPTKHDQKLERSLVHFAGSTLKCEVRQISRGNNSASAAQFYEKHEVQRVKNLFREAGDLLGKRWRHSAAALRRQRSLHQ